MGHLPINRITEKDFDSIIESAGGKRITPDGPNEKGHNADYILNEVIIELKLIREEGLLKNSRRNKLADIFRKNQPGRPVIILDPKLLPQKEMHKYYNIMERPIQTAIKKAAKQLHDTKAKMGADRTCVLVILNDGYTAFDMKEFLEVVGRKVRNDTSKIDHVIVGGLYHYSDGFEMYCFPRFELIPINVSQPFPSFQILSDAWMKWVDEYMTSIMLGQKTDGNTRLPVVDLNFNIDEIEYVKPSPPFGSPSNFWPRGERPRENTTEMDFCPPVAITFPKLSKENWVQLKKLMPNEYRLQNDYISWLNWAKGKQKTMGSELKPLITPNINYEDFISWHDEQNECLSFDSLCSFASKIVDDKIHIVIDNAIQINDCNIIIPSYIFLGVEEIGQDRIFDISSIYRVYETLEFKRDVVILENKRMFFEYALALASAYAVQAGLETVVYEIDRRYSSNYVSPTP